MPKQKSGFTLIELMVVVAIISVISLIAIPNFSRFQAKAKQANAKTELSTIYGLEKAFSAEFQMFHSNLHLIGYTPDAYPLEGGAGATADCPSTANPATGPTRYYTVGSSSNDSAVDPQPTGVTILCQNRSAYFATVEAIAAQGTVSRTALNLQAVGQISGTKRDVWSMDHNKTLSNITIGF